MKQYTFKDGIKVIASSVEDAKEKHKVLSKGDYFDIGDWKKEDEAVLKKYGFSTKNASIEFKISGIEVNLFISKEGTKFYLNISMFEGRSNWDRHDKERYLNLLTNDLNDYLYDVRTKKSTLEDTCKNGLKIKKKLIEILEEIKDINSKALALRDKEKSIKKEFGLKEN